MQWALVYAHVQSVDSFPSGLCFAGVLIHFRSGKSKALDISYILAQIMLKFKENFGMTFAKIGHIQRLKFAGMEMNQHSGKT